MLELVLAIIAVLLALVAIFITDRKLEALALAVIILALIHILPAI